MAETPEKTVASLERKLRLAREALDQAALIREKYDQAQRDLKQLNESLEEKVAERTRKIAEHQKYLQAIIDGVENPIMVIKDDYTIEIMNKSLYENLDDSFVRDRENPKCYEVSHLRSTPCDGTDHPCPLKEVLQSGTYQTVVHEHGSRDGKRKYVELAASPLLDDSGRCYGIIESARDITAYLEVQDELRQQKDILDHQAHHDALTGLPNRTLFHDRMMQLIEEGRRHKRSFALFFIDLDRFKEINDSLGHNVGDEVLKTVALNIASIIRSEDTLSRLGGDEFTILMPGVGRPSDASTLARKILSKLSKPLFIHNQLLYISSSIGISLYPRDGDTAEDLLKFADAAMYRAKDLGRDTFQFYSPEMTREALEHLDMESSLRGALDRGEFEVYYQPQFDNVDNVMIGLEALVRWNHPVHGIIYPDNFIPLAEETNLIIALDRWVMQSALTQLRSWHDEGFDPGRLALNLSTKQLTQEDFLAFLREMLEMTRCLPEWIELELTESQVMHNPDTAIPLLNAINQMGIHLAIDDFGTGYSSLAYLKRLPIQKIKIDKSFITNLPDDEQDASITRAIIALSHNLNFRVIAEGVENERQKSFLLDLHCTETQGFIHSRPVSAAELREQFLTIHARKKSPE